MSRVQWQTPDDKVGGAVTQTIDATERILDCTPLATAGNGRYPLVVEIEARDAACYIRQGGSAVALHATPGQNARIAAEGYRRVSIASAGDAYFAIERTGAANGTAVATRIDHV